MANVNKYMLIGRLTRDPAVTHFNGGGKVVVLSIAVTNRKPDGQGGWMDDPMYIDCKVYNRGENGTQADNAEKSLRKGHQVFIEGHLVLEKWQDKQTSQPRQKHVVSVSNYQFLEPKAMQGLQVQARGTRQGAAPTTQQRSEPETPTYNEDNNEGEGHDEPVTVPATRATSNGRVSPQSYGDVRDEEIPF